MLVTNAINVRYLSGFTGDSSYLIVRPADAIMLSDGRYQTQIAEQCPGLPVAVRSPSDLMPQLLQTVIGDFGVRRMGFEAADLTVAQHRRLLDDCPDTEWVETVGVIEAFRMIKDSEEISLTRRAIEVAQSAFEQVRGDLNSGWTERAIAHELEAKMRVAGGEGVSFAPIVAAGAAGALPHYEPRDAAIGEAATLLVDWGARFQGYASDLTRTLHRPTAADRFRSCYAAVLEAQLAAIEQIRPGVEARQVDAAARKVLQTAGLEEAFVHGLGHGTGLQIHEAPRISAASEQTLEAGMIVTVEPGVYFEGDFGIRIEDDILVTERGAEVLSSLPKGLDDCALML